VLRRYLLTVDVPAVWLYVLRVDRRICDIGSSLVRVTVDLSHRVISRLLRQRTILQQRSSAIDR